MSEQPLSPQGYNIKDRPVNTNPFWETEGSGSQSLEFALLGAYFQSKQPPSDLASRMREYPVVGFGVVHRSVSDEALSHDIQTLIPTRELTSAPAIHLCKTFPAMYGCNVVLCVTVIPSSNGNEITYQKDVKYTANLTRIVINDKVYYVNATTRNPIAPIDFGLCVWGVRLKEGSANE